MLSSYYVLGLGNNTEGWPLLFGAGLDKVFLFSIPGNSEKFLSVNQLVSLYRFTQKIYTISGGVSGYIEPVESWNEDYTVDVNAMPYLYQDLSNSYTGIGLSFDTMHMFILGISFGLYLTSNQIVDTVNAYNYNEYTSLPNLYNNYNKRNLLVDDVNTDLSIVASRSHNIYDYQEQFNMTFEQAVTSSNWTHTQGIKYPISNYGTTLSQDTTIYSYNYSNNYCYFNLFFGLDSAIGVAQGGKTSCKDVYKGTQFGTFTPLMYNEGGSRITIQENEYLDQLSGFSFGEPYYYLRNSRNTTSYYLYKNNDTYVPFNRNGEIQISASIRSNFNFSKVGKFNVISGDYLNIEHHCIDYGRVIGDWKNDLQYTSSFVSNTVCENLRFGAYTYEKTSYPSIMGFRQFMTSPFSTSLDYHDALVSIHQGKETETFYIAIDPQTYSISL